MVTDLLWELRKKGESQMPTGFSMLRRGTAWTTIHMTI